MTLKISYVYFLVTLQNLDHYNPTKLRKRFLFPYFPEQEAEYVNCDPPSNPLIINGLSSLFVYYG